MYKDYDPIRLVELWGCLMCGAEIYLDPKPIAALRDRELSQAERTERIHTMIEAGESSALIASRFGLKEETVREYKTRAYQEKRAR